MELEKEFELIRKKYFPRWDRKKEWKIKIFEDENEIDLEEAYGISPEHVNGFSADKHRIIYLHRISRLTIIHEITHAVIGPSHGKKFFDRMEQAAKRADDIGDHDLANALRDEIKMYKETPLITADYVYMRIKDAVVDNVHNPHISFDKVVIFIANDLGLTSDSFLQKYKRADRVYKREMKSARWLRRK